MKFALDGWSFPRASRVEYPISSLADDSLVKERKSLEREYSKFLREDLSLRNEVSYVGNKREPVLRWFRFKEAFSGNLVRRLVAKLILDRDSCVLDPFCGIGTTLFVCQQVGIPSIGIDNFPIAVFVASTITKVHEVDPKEVEFWVRRIPEISSRCDVDLDPPDIPIVKKAFRPDIMKDLLRWREAIAQVDDPLVRNIIAIIFFNVIQDVSYTSNDGQFLRLVKNKHIPDIRASFRKHARIVLEDLARKEFWAPKTKVPVRVFEWDTRRISELELPGEPDAVITSPPYLNRYDYSRSYVLQSAMYFLCSAEDIKYIRFNRLLRSHIESKVNRNEKPNHPAVAEVLKCLKMKEKMLNNPRIPHMIMAYFIDMEKCIRGLSCKLSEGARVAIVVANTRFEGEVIPVDFILTDIARRYGFEPVEIVIARYKGNSSQQMRKYGRVRVRESILIWEFTG